MLGNPDADQVAADVVSFGEPVEGLAGQIVLDDLPLELDRIAAVLGHGLSPRKPGRNSLIRVTSPVHPVGCTPRQRKTSRRSRDSGNVNLPLLGRFLPDLGPASAGLLVARFGPAPWSGFRNAAVFPLPAVFPGRERACAA